MAERIELGSVVGVFRVRGEVRLHLHNRDDSVLVEPRNVVLVLEGREREATISVRPGAGKRIIGRVAGISDPEAAAGLIGATVLIDRDQLPAPQSDEFYVADLIGLTVEDAEGTVLGTLRDIVAGERDVWIVETDEGEAWVVATRQNILKVDHEAGVVVLAAGALNEG